jgi:hypothetical protein
MKLQISFPLFSSLVAEVFETDGTPFILFVKKGGSISPLNTAKKATIEKFVNENQRPDANIASFY